MSAKKILFEIFEIGYKYWYTDIHLNSSHKPVARNKSWEIITIAEKWSTVFPELTKQDILDMIEEMNWEDAVKKFIDRFEYDWSYTYKVWVRYRVNCYIDTKWYSIALKWIPLIIPSFQDLWLNSTVKQMCDRWKGLILVTWPTWAWKSTNLAAMIEYININMKKHIITIEDPVEFAFESKKSLINQREVWNTTKWFNTAIRACLREDPDVIMIWEMRDPETIQAALTLAETGHLVLSTLHTNDSVQTIDRIVDIFPSWKQKQIRMILAMSLVWIVSQRLLPRSDKEWRIPAREIMITNDAIKNLIIWWRTHQLYWVLEMWKRSWMILMDKYLVALYKKWMISKETMMSYVRDKEWIEMMIS